MATGLPLTYSGALALADISRQRPDPGDKVAMLRAIEEAPATIDAGKAGDFAAALELFGRKLGAALPGRCIVATT